MHPLCYWSCYQHIGPVHVGAGKLVLHFETVASLLTSQDQSTLLYGLQLEGCIAHAPARL